MAYHTLFYSYNRLFQRNQKLALSETELRLRQQHLKEMVTPVVSSVKRWWSIVQEERSPLWINILAATTMIEMSPHDILPTVKSLQYSPLDMINWGYHNTNRWDCVTQPYYGRDNPDEIQMKVILPPQVLLLTPPTPLLTLNCVRNEG
jgi:hypothetical protein